MSETNTAVETEVTEETAEKKTVKQTKKKTTKKKTESVKVENTVYMGPTVNNILRNGTTFKDGVYTRAVNELITEAPMIKRLMVPVSELKTAY